MLETPEISIIVPCYNVADYLPRCLNSLMAQTLTNIEIICVNDGSTDRSADVIHEYEARFPGKIRAIHKQNEGAWKARLDGIATARGNFVGSLDGDDWAEPDFCEKLYVCIQENAADIAIGGFCREEANTGKILSTEMTSSRTAIAVNEQPERLLEINGALWNKLYSKELLQNLPSLVCMPEIFEDLFFNLIVFTRCSRIAFTPHRLIHYFVHDDSMMGTINEDQIDSTYAAMLDVKRIYIESRRSDLLEFLDAAAFLHMGVSLMFRISCDPKASLKAALHRNRKYLDENFPTWHTSDIISPRNAQRYGGAFTKLYGAKLIYQAHLMPAFLAAYRRMIASGKDIKW